MRLGHTLVFLLLLCAAPAVAQEAQCFQNEQFLVVAQDRSDSAGMEILAREPARGKIKCEYAERDGDVVVNPVGQEGWPDGQPLWFEGLAGKYLVLTRSTGPDGDILIIDLDEHQTIVDEAADDEITVSDDAVTYWMRVEAGTAKNCPQFEEFTSNGLGAVIAEEQVLDIGSGEIKSTGEKRCSATQ